MCFIFSSKLNSLKRANRNKIRKRKSIREIKLEETIVFRCWLKWKQSLHCYSLFLCDFEFRRKKKRKQNEINERSDTNCIGYLLFVGISRWVIDDKQILNEKNIRIEIKEILWFAWLTMKFQHKQKNTIFLHLNIFLG